MINFRNPFNHWSHCRREMVIVHDIYRCQEIPSVVDDDSLIGRRSTVLTRNEYESVDHEVYIFSLKTMTWPISMGWDVQCLLADESRQNCHFPSNNRSLSKRLTRITSSDDSGTLFPMAPRFQKVTRQNRRDETEISRCIK